MSKESFWNHDKLIILWFCLRKYFKIIFDQNEAYDYFELGILSPQTSRSMCILIKCCWTV